MIKINFDLERISSPRKQHCFGVGGGGGKLTGDSGAAEYLTPEESRQLTEYINKINLEEKINQLLNK